MTDQNSSDQFSAFRDGEVAGGEAERLRREIESSPEARGELADYERIAGLLHELPAERLGDEFQAAVLRSVERAMLIPAAEQLAVARGKQRRGKWLPTIAAVVATAAVLFIAVRLLDETREPYELADSSATFAQRNADEHQPADSAASEVSMAESVRAPAAAPSGAPAPTPEAVPGGIGGGEPEIVESKAAEADQAESIAKDDSLPFGAAQPSITNRVDAEPNDDALLSDLDGPPSHLEFDDKLEQAQVGEVVEAFDRSGDTVSVVRLTVVDRIAGLEHLQVLLTRNNIPAAGENESLRSSREIAGSTDAARAQPDDEKSETIAKRQRKSSQKKDAKSAESDDELVCVLVKADSVELSKALWQLREGDTFQDMRVEDPPIALADLGDYVPAVAEFQSREITPQPGEEAKQQSLSRRGGGQPGSEAATSPSDHSVAKTPAKASEAPANQQKLDEELQPDAPAQSPRQVAITIPPDLIAKQGDSPTLNQRQGKHSQKKEAQTRTQFARRGGFGSGGSRQKSSIAKSELSQQLKQNEKRTPTHPVQVLLVLELGRQVPANAAPAEPDSQ